MSIDQPPVTGPFFSELMAPNFEIDYDASLQLGDSAHHAMIAFDDNGAKWIIKSHNVSYVKALNEVEMLKKFQREGIPTLPINGIAPFIIKTDDSTKASAEIYLPYTEGLQPLTKLEWSTHVGTEDYEKRLADIKSCIGLAAKMHRRGFIHGDFQIKNIGQLRSGKIVAFDLENSREIDRSTEIVDRSKDLVSLLKSLNLNGLYSGTNPVIVEEELSDILFFYAEKFDLEDKAIEVIEKTQESFLKWFKDPKARQRALARLTLTRSLT